MFSENGTAAIKKKGKELEVKGAGWEVAAVGWLRGTRRNLGTETQEEQQEGKVEGPGVT